MPPEPSGLLEEEIAQENDGGQPMDEQVMRDRAKKHADAVARNGIDAVVADFTEALQPQFPEIAKALPQPVTAAEVLSVEVATPRAWP